MLRKTNVVNKTELQLIREELGFSRPNFAEKVIHKSEQALSLYEKGLSPIPDNVMALARIWREFYRTQNVKVDDKTTEKD